MLTADIPNRVDYFQFPRDINNKTITIINRYVYINVYAHCLLIIINNIMNMMYLCILEQIKVCKGN